MSGKMLVTQALDERDLLRKKIHDKISGARFVDGIKANEEKTAINGMTREEFAKEAEASFQQIQDLIKRFNRIDAAIVASNASTVIKTSYGDYTVAAAISLRNRLRVTGAYEKSTDFDSALLERMQSSYERMVEFAEGKNRSVQTTAESMRLSILGKEAKVKDDKPLEVVEAYVRENTMEIVDSLDIRKMVMELREKRDTLISELETQIKVSNATTFIEI